MTKEEKLEQYAKLLQALWRAQVELNNVEHLADDLGYTEIAKDTIVQQERYYSFETEVNRDYEKLENN